MLAYLTADTNWLVSSYAKLCKMTWKESDVKHCHRFLQDTELHVPTHRILENKISGHHMLQNRLKVVS